MHATGAITAGRAHSPPPAGLFGGDRRRVQVLRQAGRQGVPGLAGWRCRGRTSSAPGMCVAPSHVSGWPDQMPRASGCNEDGRRMPQDVFSEAWQQILARPSGPLAFRFYLQPAMAMYLAVRDGLRDARAGKSPYFWSLFTERGHRKELLRTGWRSIGKVVLLALALDVVYQIIVLRGLHPLEAVFIALVLAVLPYLLVRGVVTRVARRWIGPGARRMRRAA